MNIKEIEQATLMNRANIRYYEAEGLIQPQRNKENGYRIYSQEDVDTLQKIRLLRSMDVSIDQIRALQAKEASLVWTLEQHLEALEQRKDQLSRSQEIARQMVERKEEFDTMDVTKYLDTVENGEVPQQDVKVKLNLPWRRYWARGLDFSLYNTLVSLALWDFQNRAVFVPVVTLLAMLTLEPLLLSLFGTTVGKAIFGIRVTDPEGVRLTYGTALERTWTVMWEGEALRIPLISLYFRYKSLDLAEQEIPLSWENESELTYKDDKLWRYGLYVLAVLADTAIIIWAAVFLGG